MNNIYTQIKHKYQYGSIVEKLIMANIALFLVTYLLGSLSWLFGIQGNIFYKWLSLPASVGQYFSKPWTLLTYGFMHGGFIHLLFNMMFLFYIGNLFIDYFSSKKLISFYLWGTIFGGITFVASYNYFPVLQNQKATLVGASSAIMAILVGITTYMPNFELKVRFVGFVKLWVISLVFVVLDLILLNDGNTGGHLAHLGGALYGYMAIRFPYKLSFQNPFKSKTHLKTSYKASKKKKSSTTTSEAQNKTNHILEKISKSGYDSLSKEEKEFLFQQGKK
ncbi:MAG: rhomboid family intramembrane serine protease [Wenyingzhuangia sp.]